MDKRKLRGKRCRTRLNNAIPVRCIDTGVVYESQTEAARIVGMKQPYMNMLLRTGKTHPVLKLRFEYVNPPIPKPHHYARY